MEIADFEDVVQIFDDESQGLNAIVTRKQDDGQDSNIEESVTFWEPCGTNARE